ncbi:MAG: Rnf-Nqr domain containing protein [Candidatus Brocadiia bacterium]
MSFVELFTIFFGVMLINNFILSKFLGLCPFFGVSKNTKDAVSMGVAVIFVMIMASVATCAINWYFLMGHQSNLLFQVFGGTDPSTFDMAFLKTIVYILVIAVLVQFVEMIIIKTSPALYRAMGIYLPLITTNCAILGVALLNDDFAKSSASMEPTFLSYLVKSLVQGVGGGLGFTMAMLLMSGVRERLEYTPVPVPLRGIPIAFFSASIMSISFLGFTGMM